MDVRDVAAARKKGSVQQSGHRNIVNARKLLKIKSDTSKQSGHMGYPTNDANRLRTEVMTNAATLP